MNTIEKNMGKVATTTAKKLVKAGHAVFADMPSPHNQVVCMAGDGEWTATSTGLQSHNSRVEDYAAELRHDGGEMPTIAYVSRDGSYTVWSVDYLDGGEIDATVIEEVTV